MSSRRGGARDFSQLPSSPEHNLGLKAHAAEFVPGGVGRAGGQKQPSKLGPKENTGSSRKKGGGGVGRSSSRGLPDSDDAPSDLTAHAQEFVPGGRGEGGNEIGGEQEQQQQQHVQTEKMVEVVRGGTIYFVPESEALATDELVAGAGAYGVEQEMEDGFSWAPESTALPAPQRRTMHRYNNAPKKHTVMCRRWS